LEEKKLTTQNLKVTLEAKFRKQISKEEKEKFIKMSLFRKLDCPAEGLA
jgi:hypothetical protein